MSEKRTDPKSLAAVFGRQLVKLRKSHQMSQYELAHKAGLSRSAINYYESWARNPTLEIVQRISNVFDVPPSALIEEREHEASKKGPASRLEKQIEKIRALPKEKQRMISNMLDGALL